jgi:hypothetical protein
MPRREPDAIGNAARGAGVPAAEPVARDISDRSMSGAERAEAGTADAGWAGVEPAASCALDGRAGAEEEEEEAEDDDWVRETSMRIVR